MPEPLFLDTGYIIALLTETDRHRDAALIWSRRVKRERIPLVTTSAVITELVDGFNEPDEWRDLEPVLDGMYVHADTTIISVDAALFERGLARRAARPDKSWGLTDCISFCVMGERGITSALSADKHFIQAGFRALLLE